MANRKQPSQSQPASQPDGEADEQAAVERENIVFAADTAAGDIRDFILDRLKHDHSPLPWNMRPETQQRELVAQTEAAVRRIIAQLVHVIASGGRPVLRGTLVKVLVKDGLKAQIDMLMTDPLRHVLIDHAGRGVLVAIADPERFDGQRGDVKVVPDQANLLDDDDFDPETGEIRK